VSTFRSLNSECVNYMTVWNGFTPRFEFEKIHVRSLGSEILLIPSLPKERTISLYNKNLIFLPSFHQLPKTQKKKENYPKPNIDCENLQGYVHMGKNKSLVNLKRHYPFFICESSSLWCRIVYTTALEVKFILLMNLWLMNEWCTWLWCTLDRFTYMSVEVEPPQWKLGQTF
jgi:hypothetical protein